jgi:hypothetical protein
MFDIKKNQPCEPGLQYFSSQRNVETAWNNCQRGTWMLWFAKKNEVETGLIIKVIRQVKHLYPAIDIQNINAGINPEDEIKIADICREVLTTAVLKKVNQI